MEAFLHINQNKSNLQTLACLSKPKSEEVEFGIYNRIEQQQKPDATGQFRVFFLNVHEALQLQTTSVWDCFPGRD